MLKPLEKAMILVGHYDRFLNGGLYYGFQFDDSVVLDFRTNRPRVAHRELVTQFLLAGKAVPFNTHLDSRSFVYEGVWGRCEICFMLCFFGMLWSGSCNLA